MADKRDERMVMLRQSGARDRPKAVSDLVFALFRALMSRRLCEPSRRLSLSSLLAPTLGLSSGDAPTT